MLDETFSVANNHHHVLEPRSTLAYWRNGKLYVHTGTQSAVQTVASLARWMRLDINDVVLITEYTGGGYGSRATGAVISTVPAILARKVGQPVMLRISREEEHFIGGIRPAVHGRVKAGFDSDGRLLALDMFTVERIARTSREATPCSPVASCRCSISRRPCGCVRPPCSRTRRRDERRASPGGSRAS